MKALGLSCMNPTKQCSLKAPPKNGLKNESEEIFIERDGYTFRHVLSYMRDGKAVLPVTEPKKSFVEE